MPQINLMWNDSNSQLQNYRLSLLEADIDKKTNIGRDQQQCELWIAHSTVSRVHAEISFKAEWQRFYLRNLAANNPVRVDGGLLVDGEVALYEGSMIQLGQRLLQVSSIVVDDVPVPVIPPVLSVPAIQNHAPAQSTPASSQSSQSASSQNAAPQLICPKCQNPQLLSLRNSNCPVCGHFLADAASQYFF